MAKKWKGTKKKHRVPDCTEGKFCRPDFIHDRCVVCARVTDSRQLGVEKGTLRRKKFFCCTPCRVGATPWAMDWWNKQTELKAQRTMQDWRLVSDALQPEMIIEGRMPEQYRSKCRAAIRAFLSSSAQVAEVPFSDVVTVNNSIVSLGLHRQVYAELRSGATVIRKVATT